MRARDRGVSVPVTEELLPLSAPALTPAVGTCKSSGNILYDILKGHILTCAFRWLLKEQPLSPDEQKESAFTLVDDFEEVSDLLRQVEEAKVGLASDQAGEVLSSLQQAYRRSEIHGATFG
jgi:hypothetical protein